MPATPKSQLWTRAQERARERRQAAKARKACVEKVWERENYRCESCRQHVFRTNAFHDRLGHVDEIVSRAQGGDPTDPNNCRLLCYQCHFSGPSGAHRASRNWRQGRV